MKVNIVKTRIKPSILKQIKTDSSLKAVLVRDLNVSLFTVERWLRQNHRLLTTNDVIDILERELSISRKDFLEKTKSQKQSA